jgi:hypothetical protein
MNGRAFLDVARELASRGTSAHWRSASGRAYYALMLEGRDALARWGFVPPPRDNVHVFVRLRFMYTADPDLRAIGYEVEQLGRLRNKADYDLLARQFATSADADDAIARVFRALVLLDAIEADLSRRAAAIADIRSHWP